MQAHTVPLLCQAAHLLRQARQVAVCQAKPCERQQLLERLPRSATLLAQPTVVLELQCCQSRQLAQLQEEWAAAGLAGSARQFSPHLDRQHSCACSCSLSP